MNRLAASFFCLLLVAGCQRETPDQFDNLDTRAAESDSTSDGTVNNAENSNTFAVVGIQGQEILIPKGSLEPIEIDLRDFLPGYMASDFLYQFPDMKVRLVRESELGVPLEEYEIEITGLEDDNENLLDQKVRLAEFIKSYMDGTAAAKRPRIDSGFSDEEQATFRTMSTSDKYDTFLSKMKETYPDFANEWVRRGGNTGVFYRGKELLVDGVEDAEVRESIAQFILTLEREMDLSGSATVDFSTQDDISESEKVVSPNRSVTLEDYIASDISTSTVGGQSRIDAEFSDEERATFQTMSASEKLDNFVLRLETKYEGFRYDWVGKGGNSSSVYRGKEIKMYGVVDGEERSSIAHFIVVLQREMDLTGVRNDKFENAGIVTSSRDGSTGNLDGNSADYSDLDLDKEASTSRSQLDSGFSVEERAIFQTMSASDKLTTFAEKMKNGYPEFSYAWVKKDGNSDIEYRGKEMLVNGIEDTELRHSIGSFIRSLQREIDLTGVPEF